MSKKMEVSRHLLWGPVADPSSEPWIRWWEEFTKEQRRVIIEKEIDQRIKEIRFRTEALKAELDRLETMKSMIKGKV